MPADQDWKAKYLQELENAELKEHRWEEEKKLLQRMLVRTSLASEGQNAGLDKLLSQLRDEIRKNEFNDKDWQRLQDRIDQKVSALDDHKSTTNKQLRSTFEKLLSTLRDHPYFAAVKDQLRDLEKRLRKPDTLQSGFEPWLRDLASALQAGLARSADERPSKGMLSRLFGKSSSTEKQVLTQSEATSEEPFSPTVPAPKTEVETLELAQEGQEISDQRLRIARRVGELLGHMLEQVSLEPASESRARRLQENLLASDDWDELRDGLSGVAELVISAVTRSQREFEAFLRRLDERLETIRTYFAEQESAQAGRMGASAELDREIQKELDTFGQRVDSSQDFRQLKQSVSGHLQSIRDAVGRFRTKETEREKYLSEQLVVMQEKVAAMETQAEQVKDEMREQRQRAMTDVLTQLPNREAWQERLDLEFQRWRRYRNPLALAVLDIDFFKRVNDSYGHKAGDRVLQLVAKALSDRLRQTDFIARFGGEEFVLLFPETEAKDARQVLDGLREHIKALPLHFRGEPVSVSFSAGVSGFGQGDETEAVFDRADRALYQAKDAGRDQVVLASQ